MANWPNEAELFNMDTPGQQANELFNQFYDTARELRGADPTASVSIQDGNITPATASLRVDTEGQAPADDLATITPAMHDGAELLLFSADVSRVITVRHSTDLNGIRLYGGADKTLSTTEYMHLKREGDFWYEQVSGSTKPITITPDMLPLAAPAAPGAVPPGGLPGQVFRAGDNGYGWGDAPASVIVGKIDLLPFRVADLAEYAPGWHFCNGDLYPLESAVGAALNSLPANYKADWGIAVSGANISIPNLFHTDGRGYFLRAVNGSTRLPGSAQLDYMRRISGTAGYFVPLVNQSPGWGTGVFYTYAGGGNSKGNDSSQASFVLALDSSRLGENYNGPETTSLNKGATPAIFLGV